MKFIKTILVLLVAISIFSSCRKDSMIKDFEREVPNPTVNVEATINGFITNLEGEPIQDALVSVSNANSSTNEFGYFEITGLVNERFAVIRIEKDGYFDQFETLTPQSPKTASSHTRIQMIERSLSGSFAATSGGIVSLGNNSNVEFQANSFVDESDSPYTGIVSIYSAYIDPTHTDRNQFMPGNLMAINSEEQMNILQSFGMVNVELEGENGESLQIQQAATLTVGVPSSLQGDAPSTIPLWYFDEFDGLWKEEGSATLENDQYVGTVNHFTFWNCDVPFETTLINGNVFDPRGIVLARVRITDLVTGESYTSWTNSEGDFAGGVPSNRELLLEILGFCGDDDILFSQNIGPFSEATVDLGTFEITNNAAYSFVSGKLIDCDMNPVINGQVYFILPNQGVTFQAPTDNNGLYSISIPSCGTDEIEIRGVNLDDFLVSQPLIISALNGNDIDVEDIEVCADISAGLGSVTITLTDEVKVFDNCEVYISTTNSGTTSYRFQYSEALPPVGDSIIYYWIITDLNNDLDNPIWTGTPMLYSKPNSAANELYYIYSQNFQSGSTIITVDQKPELVGDLMNITVENISVGRRINDPDGPNVLTTFPGSSIMFSGVKQL